MDITYALDTLLQNFTKLLTTPIGLVYLILLTKEWRYSKRLCKLCLFGYAILLIPLNCILWMLFGNIHWIEIFIMFFNITTGMAIAAWLQAYPFPCFLFIFITVLDFLHISHTLKTTFSALWGIPPLITSLSVAVVIGFLMNRYLSRQLYHIMNTLKVSWLRLTIFPFLLFVSFLVLRVPDGGILETQNRYIPALLLSMITYSFYLLFYYLFSTTLHQQEEEEVQNVLLLQIHSMERQIANFEETGTYLKTLRHDLRHYTTALAASLENNDLDSARKILASVDSNLNKILEKTTFHNYTGDPLLDSILSYNGQRAQQASITYQVKLMLPDNLDISATDLTILMSNALENALNACEQVPPELDPFVSITSIKNGNQLFLEVANSYIQPVVFDSHTHLPAAHSPQHGLGSQSIRTIVKKVNGVCNYVTENGVFRLQILFNLK